MQIIKAILMSVEAQIESVISPLFFLLVFILYYFYKQKTIGEMATLGVTRTSTFYKLLKVVLVGTTGGIIATSLVVGIGITIEVEGFIFVIPISLLLMQINPRYACISYCAFILGIFSLTIGYPEMSLTSLLAIVGIMHLLEGLFILIDGDTDYISGYSRLDSRLVGGYSLNRIWPVPFVLLSLITTEALGGSIEMPGWWPLIKPDLIGGGHALAAIPVVGLLTYTDVSLISSPSKRRYFGSFFVTLYALSLMVIAGLSLILSWVAILGLFYMPIAHDLIYALLRLNEEKEVLKEEDNQFGLRILDIRPKSPAADLGMKLGDLIVVVNDERIVDKSVFLEILSKLPTELNIITKGEQGFNKYRYISPSRGIREIGVIFHDLNSKHKPIFTEKYGLIDWLIRRKLNTSR